MVGLSLPNTVGVWEGVCKCTRPSLNPMGNFSFSQFSPTIRNQRSSLPNLPLITPAKTDRKMGHFEQSKDKLTLGVRDFCSTVSGFCQVFIVTRAKSFSRGFAARGFGLRLEMCQPLANTKNLCCTREKPLVPNVGQAKRMRELEETYLFLLLFLLSL